MKKKRVAELFGHPNLLSVGDLLLIARVLLELLIKNSLGM